MGINKLKQTYINAFVSVCYRGDKAYYNAVNDLPKRKEKVQNELSAWEITDSISQREVMKWYFEEGVRANFNHYRNLLTSFSEFERINYIQLREEGILQKKLSFVNNYTRRLPNAGIAAYDYGIYVYLCRQGRKAGYLAADEAREYMVNVLRMVQKMYTGWNEYLIAYVVGVQFNDIDNSSKYLQENLDFFNKLTVARHSPMNQVDWYMQL